MGIIKLESQAPVLVYKSYKASKPSLPSIENDFEWTHQETKNWSSADNVAVTRIIDNMRFGAPTPHSLRHSFAINTLKRIKDKGKSPQQALPILSVYMGHSKYRYTAVYLKLTDAEHRRHLVDFTISRQAEL